MAIISVSIDAETLAEADAAVEALGLCSRSDVFRKGVKNFVSEMRRPESLPSSANAVLVVMHAEGHEDEVTDLKHDFEQVIIMQTHTKLDERHCLEIFVLKGNGKRIAAFANAISSNRHVKYSKLVLP
ncbi:MAG: CopG family ribbon-helix-helix protein [Candidatus Micrarchaeota archaeon]|nr:CopG family ribbon-helix-helix protein [Candidatus Micrarchaeota archaeon]